MNREEFDHILKITNRAMNGPDCIGLRGDLRMSLVMDIENFHRLCPIRLDLLAEADRETFLHDVVGIWNHYDRQNDRIKDCFHPRTAESNHPIFRVHQTKAVAGNPLWEIKRVRDNQTITEPFKTEQECADYLNENRNDLAARFA